MKRFAKNNAAKMFRRPQNALQTEGACLISDKERMLREVFVRPIANISLGKRL